MGSTNVTPNLRLPQWSEDDKPSWLGDLNQAFKAIDDEYGDTNGDISVLNSRMSALEARVTALENAASVRGRVG